jgi:hypothetical protein
MRTLSVSSLAGGLLAGAMAFLLVTLARPAQAVSCKRGAATTDYQEMLADFKSSVPQYQADIVDSQNGARLLPKSLFIYLQTCGNNHLSSNPKTTQGKPLANSGTKSAAICGPWEVLENATKHHQTSPLQPYQWRSINSQAVTFDNHVAHLTTTRQVKDATWNPPLHVEAWSFRVPRSSLTNVSANTHSRGQVTITEYPAATEVRRPPSVTTDHLDIYIAPEEGLSHSVWSAIQLASKKEACPIQMINKLGTTPALAQPERRSMFFGASRSVFIDPKSEQAGSLWSWKTSETFHWGKLNPASDLSAKRMDGNEVRKTIAVNKFLKKLRHHLKEQYKDHFPNVVYDEYAYLLSFATQEQNVKVNEAQNNFPLASCGTYNECGATGEKMEQGVVFREYLFGHDSWLVPGFAVSSFWMDVVPQIAMKGKTIGNTDLHTAMTADKRKAFMKKYVEDLAETFAKLHLLTGLTLSHGYHSQNAVWELTPLAAHDPLDVRSFKTKALVLDFGDGGITKAAKDHLKCSSDLQGELSAHDWQDITSAQESNPKDSFGMDGINAAWYENSGLDQHKEWVGNGYEEGHQKTDFKSAYARTWKKIVQQVTGHEPAQATLSAYLDAGQNAKTFYTALYGDLAQ